MGLNVLLLLLGGVDWVYLLGSEGVYYGRSIRDAHH